MSARSFAFPRLSKTRRLAVLGLALVPSVLPNRADAAGGAMPWDGPLTTLANALTGPTAFSLALLLGVFAVFGLVFGGELGGWIRGVLVACVGMATLVAIPTLATALGINVGGMVGM